MKKIITLVIIFGSLNFSCEQENVDSLNKIEDFTLKTTSSSKFTNIGLQLSSFETVSASFLNAEEKSIFIPLKGQVNKAGLLSYFNKENEVISVHFFEWITDTPSDLVYDEIKEGRFNGIFNFQNQYSKKQITIEKSEMISTSFEKNKNSNSRMEECDDWDSPGSGGVFGCAGLRIEQLNAFSKLICYATFLYCLADNIAQCYDTGCEADYDFGEEDKIK